MTLSIRSPFRTLVGVAQLILLLGFVAVADGADNDDYKPKPLPAGAESFSHKQYLEGFSAYCRTQTGTYAELTQDPSELHADGLRLFEEQFQHKPEYYFVRDPKQLDEQAKSLRKRGSRDTWLSIAEAASARVHGRISELGKTIVPRLFAAAADKRNPPYIRYRARVEVLLYAKAMNQFLPYIQKHNATAITALTAWLADADPHGLEARYAWDLTRPQFKAVPGSEQIRFAAALAKQKVDPWLIAMALGEGQYNAAWDFLNRNLTSGTEDERMAKFKAMLPKGVAELTKAYELQPQFPEPGESLILIAGQNDAGKSTREWFDLCAAGQFDYHPIYLSYMTSLRPRWGGDYHQMHDFAQECIKTDRWDTDVPYMLLLMVNSTYVDDSNNEMLRVGGVYDDVEKCLEHFYTHRPLSTYGSPFFAERETRMWHIGSAIAANRFDAARKQLDQLEDHRPPLGMYGAFRVRYPDDTSMTYAMTGPAKAETSRINELLVDQVRYDPAVTVEARELLAKARTLDPHVQSQWYFRHWENVLETEEKFVAGENIELRFEPDLIGLRQLGGNWDRESDRSIVGEITDPNVELRLSTVARFRHPYELSLTMETVENDSWGWRHSLELGYYPSSDYEDFHGMAMYHDPRFQTLQIRGFLERYRLRDDGASRRRIDVETRPGHTTMVTNGNLNWLGEIEDYDPSGPVMFGTMNLGDPHRGKLRIKDVVIRRIDRAAPPSDPAARLAYCEQILKTEPDNIIALTLQGRAQYALQQYEAALTTSRRLFQLLPDSEAAKLLEARCLIQLKRPREAETLLVEYLPKAQDGLNLRLKLAEIYTTLGGEELRDPKKAIAQILIARKAFNIDLAQNRQFAVILSNCEQYDAALSFAKRMDELAGPSVKPSVAEFIKELQKRVPYVPGPDEVQ